MKINSCRLPIYLLLWCTSLALPSILHGQESRKMIERSFHEKKPELLRPMLSGEVELSLEDDIVYLSNPDCIMRLRTWLADKKTTKISGKVAGSDEVRYYRGLLKTDKGPYRVTMYFTRDKGQPRIDEIGISPAR